MAELVDALVSGTSVRKYVQVRVLFWAPKVNRKPVGNNRFFYWSIATIKTGEKFIPYEQSPPSLISAFAGNLDLEGGASYGKSCSAHRRCTENRLI